MSRVTDRIAHQAVTSDWLPACPRCGDLNDPGSTVCAGCGAHLLVGRLLRERGGEVTLTAIGATALLPERLCPVCLLALDETGYCDSCSFQDTNDRRPQPTVKSGLWASRQEKAT